ncbi:MAG TPA: S41 family peptidase [Bryobacteraceae bacterium]|nr:S41 family peptidase [Bryobacteraceae bacterium]
MRKILIVAILCSLCLPAVAQLTTDQKVADFQYLAGVFAKRYAFYEWKKTAVKFDGLDLAPWLDKVRGTTDDLSFLQICAEYVAGYQDSHIAFLLPSTFTATDGITADVYSGKVVLDSIDRTLLPEKDYGFQVGDEIYSVNAVPLSRLLSTLSPIAGEANSLTSSRVAAGMLLNRSQERDPYANKIEKFANVEVIQQGGKHYTATVWWNEDGIAYPGSGRQPSPRTVEPRHPPVRPRPRSGREAVSANGGVAGPDYMKHLRMLRNFRIPGERFISGEGDLAPFFAMPASFKQRLGDPNADEFFTGTFAAGAHTIGFVRIPTFEFFDISPLQSELTWMNTNTDALVVDVTRNPGGYGCNAEDAAAALIPTRFQSLGQQIRVTWEWLFGFEQDLQYAQQFGAPQADIDSLKQVVSAAQKAYAENRGFTTTLPLCGDSETIEPATDSKTNKVIAYTKPILLLTDNGSASAAELFAAILQDNKRSTQFGMRTMGAGGAVVNELAGVYMDASVNLPESILIRSHNVEAPGLPAAPYVENIGVIPDSSFDYQTLDNLQKQGKPFVDAFTAAVVNLIPAAAGK